jgi:microcystin-dependent protein
MIVKTLGSITLFAGTRIPDGFAKCEGQLLPIVGNEALYSIIGISYGGDGRTNFALPNLIGKVPVQFDKLGTQMGQTSIQLTPQHIPSLSVTNVPVELNQSTSIEANSNSVINDGVAVSNSETVNRFATKTTNNTVMDRGCVINYGSVGTPISLMQPTSVLNYIICINGYYPDLQ